MKKTLIEVQNWLADFQEWRIAAPENCQSIRPLLSYSWELNNCSDSSLRGMQRLYGGRLESTGLDGKDLLLDVTIGTDVFIFTNINPK